MTFSVTCTAILPPSLFCIYLPLAKLHFPHFPDVTTGTLRVSSIAPHHSYPGNDSFPFLSPAFTTEDVKLGALKGDNSWH